MLTNYNRYPLVFLLLFGFFGCSSDDTNSTLSDSTGGDASDVATTLDTMNPSDSNAQETGTTDADPPDLNDTSTVEVGPADAPTEIPGTDTGSIAETSDTNPADVPPPTIADLCFSGSADPTKSTPDYDQFAPIVGSHCFGTNHQDIVGVQQVVVLGDSVSQGTPNLAHPLSVDNSHFFRNLLAQWLSTTFNVDTGNFIDWGLWKTYDYVSGGAGKKKSGNFWNCADWGARTDDFLAGKQQIQSCFPTGGSTKKTLIFFTMGGNDISTITELGAEASPAEVQAGYPATWAVAYSTIDYLREAVQWLKDPERFPNGSYVIFANPFEFTDATGNVSSCPAAGLIGYDEWANPEIQREIVIYILEQYVKIAVETQTDVIWSLEHFCGHGYVATGPNADVNNECYLGPDTELYFDETCIHPSDAGHAALFDMFKTVIVE